VKILQEYQGAAFGDVRLGRRLETIVGGLSRDPSRSFPTAAGGDSAVEGTYRFLANDEVSAELISAPHFAATAGRAKGQTVLVAHDTTEFRFREREGMGRLSGDTTEGFLSHVSLAILPGEERTPLGVLALYSWARTTPARKKRTKSKRTNHIPAAQRESQRWWTQVEAAEQQVDGHSSLVHLMDSEADAYPLLCQLNEAKRRFVVRLHVNRRIDGEAGKLDPTLMLAQTRLRRAVPLSARPGTRNTTGKGRHAPRTARLAELEVSASDVTLHAPSGTDANFPKTTSLTVVRVFEPNPPEGAVAIEWKLATTEPVTTDEEIAKVVDAYRSRWVIEEFFKALKTGCAFETRQLESYEAITKALAIFTPIACELLLLRATSRHINPRLASTYFRPTLWLILRNHPKLRLTDAATVSDALAAIAQLGGHLKNNGPPGWRVLGRGYDEIIAMELGLLISRGIPDQS
jgi:hypothetical protein